ncbi:MAG TPA: DNA replication protein DnaC [Alphaproteobacteria bacterium]|nr:DNA replication protein DnaC [Rhodospirillaceae bacterium]HRJ12763.1 DNA replication protein DnaC [Alphaproteobacteria bacterium]
MTLPEPAATYELWGHETAEKNLLQLALSGRMPHAWIFTGPAGVGKATLAFRLARFLLYRGFSYSHMPMPPENLAVLPEAPTSAQIAAGSHPDLMVIAPPEAGKDINVEQIRAVPPFLSMTASQGSWRIVIVDGAESMNRAAQNALLKVLEEPSPNSVLILLAENTGALLPTIRSRARLLRLVTDGAAAIDRIAQFDPRISELTQASQQYLWKMAGNAPGQVLQLLDQDALTYLNHLLGYMQSPTPELANDLAKGFAYQPQFQTVARVLLWLLHQLALGETFGLRPVRLPELLQFHADAQTMLAETDGLNLDGNACWHVLLTRLPTIFEA